MCKAANTAAGTGDTAAVIASAAGAPHTARGFQLSISVPRDRFHNLPGPFQGSVLTVIQARDAGLRTEILLECIHNTALGASWGGGGGPGGGRQSESAFSCTNAHC